VFAVFNVHRSSPLLQFSSSSWVQFFTHCGRATAVAWSCRRSARPQHLVPVFADSVCWLVPPPHSLQPLSLCRILLSLRAGQPR
jgi:hypothetical protein